MALVEETDRDIDMQFLASLIALCDADDDEDDEKRSLSLPRYGRGNAKSGRRQPYYLYRISDVYHRVLSAQKCKISNISLSL